MRTTSRSLTEDALDLSERNASAPQPPPAYAELSPLHELLVAEVGGQMPRELASRLEAAATVSEVNDVVAAGTMLRWIGDDEPFVRAAFLQRAARDPERAGLALAEALGARMAPPVRTPEWRSADRLGLGLELGTAAVLLALRGLAAIGLASLVALPPAGSGFLRWLAGAIDLPLLGASRSSLAAVAALAVLAVLHAAEALVAPALLEAVRRSPARIGGLAPPRSWRLDGFQAAWAGQAALLWAATAWSTLRALAVARPLAAPGERGVVALLLLVVGLSAVALGEALRERLRGDV